MLSEQSQAKCEHAEEKHMWNVELISCSTYILNCEWLVEHIERYQLVYVLCGISCSAGVQTKCAHVEEISLCDGLTPNIQSQCQANSFEKIHYKITALMILLKL